MTQTLITQAQSTFTICKGEEVVWVSAKPETYQPVRGCYGVNIRTIEPYDGFIDKTETGYIMAPIFTTTYTVTNRLSFAADSGCYYNDFGTEEFTIYVQECENLKCNVLDPFNELAWLNSLINIEDENGSAYYDFVNLYEVEGENYLEIFPELDNAVSQIYTCDGSLFCERTDSLSCNQFTESTLVNALYNTTCTATAEQANSGDNKVDLKGISYTRPIELDREQLTSFQFSIKNNGPCYLYETNFVIEVNGEVIGMERWMGAEAPNNIFTVYTELKHLFKSDTDYTVRVWPVNPNGNRDLILTNDTLTVNYESFESRYDFKIQQFIPLSPTSKDTIRPISIILDNKSNAKPDEINIYWSVNGEEQEPLTTEDFAYNLELTTFWDRYATDTIEIGKYFFESGKPYLIEARIELSPETQAENIIQDKISYFVSAISPNIDLAITGLNNPLHKKINDTGELKLEIVNRGNIKVNEFTIKWFINDVEQTPVKVQNPDWQTQTNYATFDEKLIIVVDTLNIEDGIDYELHFIVETPAEYADNNLDNNTYTFNYKAEHKKYYQADLYVEVCKTDSVVLSVREYTTYNPPPCPGCTPGCGYCDITFINKRWTLDEALIDTTLSITVKPTNNALYVFSTDANADCGNSCDRTYEKNDITVGVVLVDCDKPASLGNNCTNHLGKVSSPTSIDNLDNQISDSRIKYIAHDTDGIPLNLTSAYVKFDYELFGPQITLPANIKELPSSINSIIYQPITITCLEEIGFLNTYQTFRYEVCEGDQIEEVFEMPPSLPSVYEEIICNNLQSVNTNMLDQTVNGYISDDCNFIFKVEKRDPKRRWETINFTSKLQTGNYSTLTQISWHFTFNYQNNCEPIINPIFITYSFLTNFVNPTACNGESVYVYDADTYKFLIVKTNLGESLYKTNGELICFSPADGFSFIGLYNESRILDSWVCEAGFQGRESTPTIQDQGIQIFPNPTTNKVFINLQQLAFEQALISLYNVNGKQVKQLSSIDAFAGIVELNVQELPKGIYLVEVQAGDTTILEKLMIE